MTDLLRILALWRTRTGWLLFGLLISLIALAAGVGLMVLSGRMIGDRGGAGRGAGPRRAATPSASPASLGRYFERLVTHAATFRALADLRVWFFRHLARTGAGGLGFRQAGDVLARLVGDVEALDGLYLRILLPLAGAVLLLPGCRGADRRARSGACAIAVGVLFAMPRLAAAPGSPPAAPQPPARGWPKPPAACASPRSTR